MENFDNRKATVQIIKKETNEIVKTISSMNIKDIEITIDNGEEFGKTNRTINTILNFKIYV